MGSGTRLNENLNVVPGLSVNVARTLSNPNNLERVVVARRRSVERQIAVARGGAATRSRRQSVVLAKVGKNIKRGRGRLKLDNRVWIVQNIRLNVRSNRAGRVKLLEHSVLQIGICVGATRKDADVQFLRSTAKVGGSGNLNTGVCGGINNGLPKKDGRAVVRGNRVKAVAVVVGETMDGILDGGFLMEVNLVWTVLFMNFLVSVTVKILFPLNHYEDLFRCFLAINSQSYPEKERKS